MHDFFDKQEAARKSTGRLVVLFVLAVFAIVMAVYVSVWLVGVISMERLDSTPPPLWSAGRFALIGGLTLAVIIAGTLYKVRQLSGGGSSVAEMLGGRLVSPSSTDQNERRLLNVVEEMAIASGVPVPRVYVLDAETGINAFAAGFGMDDAVIAVTRGTLELLTRDELQGVVAHEYSHILNCDILINIRLMGILHGILLIGLIGSAVLRGTSRGRGRGAAGAVALGFGLLVIGYAGIFFGGLIKSAVSRQREYLADASGVQFTRNPLGLAGALKKIGGITFGSVLVNKHAEEASHMFIADGVGNAFVELFSSHPPLDKRILRLDPSFDGTYPRVKALLTPEPEAVARLKSGGLASGFVPSAVTGYAVAGVLESVGAPLRAHADMASAIMAAIPEEIRDAGRSPESAEALVYALLLDDNVAIRAKQLAYLTRKARPGASDAALALFDGGVRALDPRVRLPIAELAVPALQSLPPEEYQAFRAHLGALVQADRKTTLFEYTLRHVIISRLDAHHAGPRKKVAQLYSVRAVLDECAVVLSLMAHVGHARADDAARAFAGGRLLLVGADAPLPFKPLPECTMQAMDVALDRLALASPMIKKRLLGACLECLSFDSTVSVNEAELFRAVSSALEVPAPPWVTGGVGSPAA
jgi:Zn-dependent protease with chaperone function